jgi:ribosome-interacting GTPase 1
MPTNLPPEYFDADKRFRDAQSTPEKVARLEELISTVPKHKGTDKLRADLRRQLSRLKSEAQEQKLHPARHASFRVEREGAGQAVLLGLTNVGKSALVTALTNATPEVSASPYTTWKLTPGMMEVAHTQVQLVDTPPLDRDFMEPGFIDLVRRTDVALLVVDIESNPIEQLEESLAILRDHRIVALQMRSNRHEDDCLTFLPFLVLVNKCDDQDSDEDFEILSELLERRWPLTPVSALTRRNLDRLRMSIFEQLDVIRVFTQAPGEKADLQKPFVLKKGSTVTDLARKIHKDFSEKMKSSRVWGSSAFDGQMVQRDYVLRDGDIVEFKV